MIDNLIQHTTQHNPTMSKTLKQFVIGGKDDALKADLVPLDDFIYGKEELAFCHVYFLKYMQSFFGTQYEKHIDLLIKMSIIRNTYIIEGVNKKFAEHNNGASKQLKMMTITDEMKSLVASEAEIRQQAKDLKIDVSLYLDYDLTNDIEDCSNEFCRKQLDQPGEAADRVTIVKDTDGTFYLLVITRAFGPGKYKRAYPGGFKEVNESYEMTAFREGTEEVQGITQLTSSDKSTTTYIKFPVITSFFWDPRGPFVHGMKNGGIGECVTIH